MWYLFMILFAAAGISGLSAFLLAEHRKMWFAICFVVSIAAFALFLHMFPLEARIIWSPYLWGGLLIFSYLVLRTQVRRFLI